MKKEEFFIQIMEGISYFEENEIMEIKNYYEELILDGIEMGATEEEVIKKLDGPKAIVERLKLEYSKPERDNQEASKKRILNGEYIPKGMVSSVKIQAEDRGVQIKTSLDNQVRIHYEGQEYDEIIYHEIEGVFYFRQRERRKFSFLKFGFSRKVSNIVLEVPKDKLAQIEVITQNGGIKCSDIVVEEKLSLVTSNGAIVAESACSKRIKTITTNGSIKLELVQAQDIELKTTNGSIKGTIIGNNGDYEIHSKTSNGSNNLPDGWGNGKEKKLAAFTSNGSISIEFVD